MFFNSIAFALFLPSVLGLYWIIPSRLRVHLLLVASYVFYGWWDHRFLALIVLSTVTDFYLGRALGPENRVTRRRQLLAVSVVVNLGVLAFFKYWGFFVDSAAALLIELGAEPNLPFLSVVLPVGISFYTFQTLSYTIDIYRGSLEPETNLSRFALFVAFFPQLVAGPIERASNLLPQIRNLPVRVSQVAWGDGATLILRGLFRKVVIADGVAPLVNQVFGIPARFGGLTIAFAVIGFSLQIYGDFAGYTDIARGTAKLFGVDLMENFRAPYFARSFRDFWHRWHISLSTWLRDYLYIPLGGSQSSVGVMYRNLMITMVLGGLWHGAGWGFVLWGTLHGVYLATERAFRERAKRSGRAAYKRQLPPIFVFLVVTLTWIPFRSPTFSNAIDVFTGLLRPFDGEQLSTAPVVLAVLGLATLAIDTAVLKGVAHPLAQTAPLIRGVGYGAAAVAAVLFASQANVPFIYFQF